MVDDDRSYFVVVFFIHPAFLPGEEKEEKSSEKKAEKSSEKKSNAILILLRKKSVFTIPELSNELGISTRAVEKQINSLKKAGKLKRRGARKEGWWEVVGEK